MSKPPEHNYPKPYYIVPLCDKEVDILYQDDYLLVVEKPEFLLTVPGRAPENKDCLITRIQKTHPSAVIIHRLDLDTSGILIVPIERETMSKLARQFQEREIEKSYQALVWGKVEAQYGSIDLPIKTDWPNRPKQKIDISDGKKALTDFENLGYDAKTNATRLALYPVTGRTHQLRIHCMSFNHPIMGCDMYAHEQAFNAAPRLLLHAESIAFTHPKTNKRLSFRSKVPF